MGQIPISSPKMPTLLDPEPPSTQRLLSRRNDQPYRTPLALLSRARLDGTCIPVRTESLDTGPHDFTFSVGAITMLRGEGAKVLGHNVDSHGYVKDQYRALDFGLVGFLCQLRMREKREKHRILGLGWVVLCSAGECGIRRGRDQIPISISIVSGPEAATNGRDAPERAALE